MELKKITILIFILLVTFISMLSGCLEVPKESAVKNIKVEIDDVTLHLTCKHSKVLVGDKEYGITPGLLLVNIDISLTNTGESPIKLESKDITVKNNGQLLYEPSIKSNDNKFSLLSISPKQTIPITISTSWDGGSPFNLQLFVFDELIDLENIPLQKNRFTVSLNSDIVVNSSSVLYEGAMFDSVTLTFRIKNNGRATWYFDIDDAINPTDTKSSGYALAKEKPGCYNLTIRGNEEKNIDLIYITYKMDPGFQIDLRPPFEGIIEIPKSKIKIGGTKS